MSIKPTFAGEMQLAGWSETHTGGCKVTFWLQSSEDLDAFRALTVRKGNTAGHRFMAALVEIGDDEAPVVDHPVPDTPVADHEPAPVIQKGGERAKLCGIWCNTPDFQDWMRRHYPAAWRLLHPDAVQAQERAAIVLRHALDITSRSELDHDQNAAERFETLIRRPYMAHLESRGVAA